MSSIAPLHALTREIEPSAADVMQSRRGQAGYAWIRGSRALIGWGRAAVIPIGTGTDRFEIAARASGILDGIELEGSAEGAPVAFTAITFDAATAGSSIIVPEALVRADEDVTSLTVTGPDRAHLDRLWTSARSILDARRPGESGERIRYAGASNSELHWLDAVASVLRLIERSAVEKVVLARDVHVWSRVEFDVWSLARRLAPRFPDCFTYVFDGLVGSSPELLVRRRSRGVESVVLAGSARRGDDRATDASLGGALIESEKELAEHELAVTSVAEPLRTLCTSLAIEGPGLLRLANVQHIATRISGELRDPLSALEIAGRLHPTAAVGGAPRAAALDAITSLEKLDRGRYAGVVGVLEPNGDGELAIALRCGEFDGARGRLFAGAGIVRGSTPEAELEETRLKLRAMEAALAEVAS